MSEDQEPLKAQLARLLHKLWTAAPRDASYVKDDWMALERAVHEAQRAALNPKAPPPVKLVVSRMPCPLFSDGLHRFPTDGKGILACWCGELK